MLLIGSSQIRPEPESYKPEKRFTVNVEDAWLRSNQGAIRTQRNRMKKKSVSGPEIMTKSQKPIHWRR